MSAFDREVKEFADGLGISLYQRFTVDEAALFLRVPQKAVNQLIQSHAISYIQLTKTEIQFFGFQLVDYLLQQTRSTLQPTIQPQHHIQDDRIMRYPEVKETVGLSRTTIWRKEKAGEFPARVSLGTGSVGWKKSEIDAWVDAR